MLSSASSVIPRRAHPGLAGLRPYVGFRRSGFGRRSACGRSGVKAQQQKVAICSGLAFLHRLQALGFRAPQRLSVRARQLKVEMRKGFGFICQASGFRFEGASALAGGHDSPTEG